MPSAVKAGGAFISIGADTGPLKLAGKAVRGTFQGMIGAGKIAAAGIGAGFAAATATVGASLVQFASFGDQIEKLSQRTRISTETLSQLKFAAEQSGSSIESVGAAIFRSNRRIANAAMGTGPAVRALKELGISAEELTKLSPEDQFFGLADALSSMDDQSKAAQLGFEIWGDNFRDIAPLLRQGSDGMRQLMQQADDLGATLSTEGAARAAQLSDAWNEAKTAGAGLFNTIGEAAAPFAIVVSKGFGLATAALSKWVRGLDIGSMAFGALGEDVGTAVFDITELILAGDIEGAWENVMDEMASFTRIGVEKIKNYFLDLWDETKGLFDSLWTEFNRGKELDRALELNRQARQARNAGDEVKAAQLQAQSDAQARKANDREQKFLDRDAAREENIQNRADNVDRIRDEANRRRDAKRRARGFEGERGSFSDLFNQIGGIDEGATGLDFDALGLTDSAAAQERSEVVGGFNLTARQGASTFNTGQRLVALLEQINAGQSAQTEVIRENTETGLEA